MIIDILMTIVGFIFLIFGADILIKGASNIAKKFHIPEIIIGLTIVCVGTSMPEIFITLTSAIKGHSDLIIGNAIGSNLCNILLILGLISVIKPVKIEKDIKRIHLPIAVFATVFVLILGNLSIGSGKFVLSTYEGIILLVLFAIYFSYPIIIAIKDILKSSNEKTIKKNRQDISVIKALICIISGIVLLKYGGDFVVDYASNIALRFNISERIIGLTIVAIGTALPELITSIIATIEKDAPLALGNLIGSCMLNLWLILGIGSIITPLVFSIEFNFNLVLLSFATLVVWLFSYAGKEKDHFSRFEGAVLLLIFFVYITRLFVA